MTRFLTIFVLLLFAFTNAYAQTSAQENASRIDFSTDSVESLNELEDNADPLLRTNAINRDTANRTGLNKQSTSSRNIAPREEDYITIGDQAYKPFGSNLFTGNFAQSAYDSRDDTYNIVPGDRIRIEGLGDLAGGRILTVDSQGNVFIPNVGPVNVAGQTISGMKIAINNKVRGSYTSEFSLYTELLPVNPIAINVTGFVKRPGRYAGVPSDNALHYLDNAGGINPLTGSYRDIDIMRDGQRIATMDLYDFILDGVLPDVKFQTGDTIVVRKRGPIVAMTGDIAEPSLLEFRDQNIIGQNALAIIPELSTATDITVEGTRGGKPYLVTMPLATFLDTGIQNGDRIILQGKTNNQTMLVYVQGVHDSPETIAVKRTTRLVELLSHIKVNPEVANVDAIHIRRKSVALSQKNAILDSLYRLERSSLLALSGTHGEASIRVNEAKLMTEFVSRAKQIETLGTVVTSINDQQQNILLEPEDVIIIPAKTNVIQIGGEVFSPQAVVYKDNYTLRDYIEMAGGYSPRADKTNVAILRANGETATDINIDLKPGDQILVLPKIDQKIFQNTIDLTQILSQIALTAGIIIGL